MTKLLSEDNLDSKLIIYSLHSTPIFLNTPIAICIADMNCKLIKLKYINYNKNLVKPLMLTELLAFCGAIS